MAFPHRLVLHRPVMQHDPALGHGFVPNVRVRICHERGSYVLRTNAQGYRSNSDFGVKGERPRVVVYGDSFAAGDGVANEERFTDLVAQSLGAECVNLAVSGAAPDQNVLLAETRPEAAAGADLVLWCVAAHTIDRIRMRHRTTFDAEGRLSRVARPYFEWDQGALVTRGVPVPDAREMVDERTDAELELGATGALRTARERVRAGVLEPMRSLVRGALGAPEDARFLDADSESWRLMSALARRFREAVGDVPLMIVPLPNRHHVEGRLQPTYRALFERLLADAGLDATAHGGTTVVDLFQGVVEAPNRRSVCYPFDGHYTPEGHRVIAAALAGSIADAGFRRVGAPTAAAPSRAADSLAPCMPHELEVEWDHAGSRARLVRAHDRSVVCEAEEAEVAGRLGMLGAVPFTAINVCLDQAAICDAAIERVVLRSPGGGLALRGGPAAEDAWAAWAAPWIRWIGAAEIDVRRQLAFSGLIVIAECEAVMPLASEVAPADGESRWLYGELKRRRGAPATRRSRSRCRGRASLRPLSGEAARGAAARRFPIVQIRTTRRTRLRR